jgi:hypothetical protein
MAKMYMCPKWGDRGTSEIVVTVRKQGLVGWQLRLSQQHRSELEGLSSP